MAPEPIELRSEIKGPDRRYLRASIEEDGRLVLIGQDLGPSTAPVSSDGEYEWQITYAAEDVPAFLAALGAGPAEPAEDVLRRFTGRASYDLERISRSCGVRRDLWVRGG